VPEGSPASGLLLEISILAIESVYGKDRGAIGAFGTGFWEQL
jgi:hypothetical protein